MEISQPLPQALPCPLPLEIENDLPPKDPPVHFLFEPIRYCGRKWTWALEDTSKDFLKMITIPFLALLTFFAGILAFIGTLITPPEQPVLTQTYMEETFFPLNDNNLDITNKMRSWVQEDDGTHQLDEEIKQQLSQYDGCQEIVIRTYARPNTSIQKTYYNDLTTSAGHELVNRCITLSMPSEESPGANYEDNANNIFDRIKYHFENRQPEITEIPGNLRDVYLLLTGQDESSDKITNLINILSHCNYLNIVSTLDLAYVRVGVSDSPGDDDYS
ncbi:MAG: hypothetical protein S4CHLAM20_01460 [Chlamydiia bacterium]|nr:hypothetical protein [Chlamydiia bacterium]